MPGELATKLRLVRCPKCRLLLPELPHYDVYKCGGCSATLQAKRRKSEEVNSESSSHESKKTPRNSSGLVSEDPSGKKEQLVFSLENVERTTTAAAASSGELSLDDNCRKSQNQNGLGENDLGTKTTECSSVENAGRDQSERGECNAEQLAISNLSDKDLEYEMYASEHSGIKINRHEVSNKCCSTGLTTCEIKANDANLQLAGPKELNNDSLLLKGSEEELYSATHEQNLRSDVPGGAKSTANTTESFSTSKSTANVAPEKASISHITACIGKGHATSDDHVISSTELLKQSQSSINISFERGRSTDISDATEVINLGSEFSGTLGELSNSPTTRSSHAYDGSVSSYDGVDELIPGYQHLNPLDNTNSVVDDVSDERPRMSRILVDSMTYGDSKAHQRLNFSSDFPSENHHVKAVDRKEFQSKMPFHYSGSQSVYESGSPPNQLLDEIYSSSTFLPSDTCEDPDQEKMKLLRMIYILQDQLSRSGSVNGEINGRLSSSTYKGKHTLPYLSHDLQEERFHQALDYLKCDGRCNHGINRGQRHKLSLNPGSAEATSSTNHVPLSCLHCFLQEWQCPAELPPYVCQHEGPCRYHHGHNYCSPHYSYPLIPRWTMNSKTSLYSCETKSDYQMHRTYEANKYPREKQNLANRHVRPVAGGAPFVTCHRCFRLLQLPADFLLKLKCGSCSEVLKFSQMKSYEPGKLNDRSKVVNGSNRPSEPDANRYNSSPAVPFPYSDNYGLSVSKSCSSEDPFSLSAFRSLHDWGYDQSVSGGMSEAITEKEKIASSHSINNPIGTSRSAGLVSNVLMSKKVSSQTDARAPPPPRSSPLHQLMGYTSFSQVIRGTK
ncbi:hypothetical protein K1719_023733 [Acacia pycnantha]|nr:hypothetical protein K1719_023733 [Acacia pycnantha]